MTDRVLYIVLAHRDYDQVGALITLISAGGGKVLVHANPRGESWENTATGRLVGDGMARVVRNPIVVGWGDSSIFAALLRSYEEALSISDWDWIATLSGQDFPLRPVSDHIARLATDAHDAWLDVNRVPLHGHDERPEVGVPTREILRRHAFSYAFLRGEWARRVPVRAKHAGIVTYRKAAEDMLAFGVRTSTARRLDALFARGLHFGSSWMDLRRDVVTDVLGRIHGSRRVARLCRATFHADETILPSLVMEVARHPSAHENHRFVKWPDDSSGHTSLISLDDLDDVLASAAHFGRRFDFGAHPEVLERLLPVVGGSRSLLDLVASR